MIDPKAKEHKIPYGKTRIKKHRSTISRENNMRKTEGKKGLDGWDVRLRYKQEKPSECRSIILL